MDSEDPRECSKCGGTGWVVKEEGSSEVVVACPKCRLTRRRRFLFEHSEIPSRYRHKGFEEFQAFNPELSKVLALSKRFVRDYPGVKSGILFAGKAGVGKTHLAVAILKSLIEERMVPGRFVDESEFLRRLQYSYGPDSTETERQLLLPLMQVELLLWDDLGTGRPTEWAAETIRTVINNRYTQNRITLFTTNWPLKKTRRGDPDPRTRKKSFAEQPRPEETLEERIGARLYSRLMEMCQVTPVKSRDYRKELHSEQKARELLGGDS